MNFIPGSESLRRDSPRRCSCAGSAAASTGAPSDTPASPSRPTQVRLLNMLVKSSTSIRVHHFLLISAPIMAVCF